MCSCHRYLSEKDVDAAVQKVANEHACRQVEADPEQRPHATARRREDGLETVSGHGARRAGRGPEEPAVLYPTRPHGLVVGHGSRLARRRRRFAAGGCARRRRYAARKAGGLARRFWGDRRLRLPRLGVYASDGREEVLGRPLGNGAWVAVLL